VLDVLDAYLKNVCNTSLGITYTTCHFQGKKQSLACVRFSKLVQLLHKVQLHVSAIDNGHLVVGLEWYPCCRLKHICASACNTDNTPSVACDYSVELPHWPIVLGSMCVGVSVWLGWSGIRVAG